MLILKKKYQSLTSLLLNSFRRSISSFGEEGSILDGKDEIIFFKSFQEQNVKYQSLLKTQDQTNLIFLLSLNEKISCGPLVKKIQGQNLESLLHSKLEILNDDKEFTFNFSEQIFGSIVDYQGHILEPKEISRNNENITQQFSKTYKIQEIFKQQAEIHKRLGTDGQLWTGNLAIDFSSPIAKGNYVIFKGERSTGKSFVASNLIQNFIELLESPIYNKKFKTTKAIYVTLLNTNAQKMKKSLDLSLNNPNFVIFSPSQNSSLLEKFLLPFSALKFARDMQNADNDVLFVFDDSLEHFYKEYHLFNAMNQPFSPLSICNELSSVSGCFEKGSLTTLLIIDTNEPEPAFYKDVERYKNNAESLADVIINFDLKDEIYRHIKPKIDFVLNRNVNPWQSRIICLLKEELRLVLDKLKEEKLSLEGRKALKIHIDPWDSYFFLDSIYFMRLLISKKFYTPIESLIILKFTLRAIEEDFVSLLKDEPDILSEKLFNFCKKYKEYEGKDIITFLKEKMVLNFDDPNLTNFVLESINRLTELFLTNLKMTDSLLPFKKDYFK